MTRVLRAASTTSLVITVSIIDAQDAFDLNEQPMQKTEVSAGDAGNRGNGLVIGEIGVVKGKAKLAPMAGQDKRGVIALERPVMVGETHAAVKLWIPGHAFLDSGHADEKQADVLTVEPVADVFQGVRGQAFGLINHQQLDEACLPTLRDSLERPMCSSMQRSTRLVNSLSPWRGSRSPPRAFCRPRPGHGIDRCSGVYERRRQTR
ncbi:hypothetical protein MTYM_01933 [Methylococcales bacterium]|nr:hypothetical protein MTYM_01933 [Methylococcales bacterium]